MRLPNFLCLVAVMCLGLLFASPSISLGHVFPDHSDPKVGSTITDPPPLVRIWFDGDIEPAFSTITVQNMDGNKVDRGDEHVDPKDKTLLEVSVPPLPPGAYVVMWSVVARDGHRTEGKYMFTVK